MAEHTKGPWSFTEYYGTWYIWAPVSGSGMVADSHVEDAPIGRIRGTGRGATPEEQLANARLIAAAPEMSEALEAAVFCIEAFADRLGHDYAEVAALATVRAALRKAKGEA